MDTIVYFANSTCYSKLLLFVNLFSGIFLSLDMHAICLILI